MTCKRILLSRQDPSRLRSQLSSQRRGRRDRRLLHRSGHRHLRRQRRYEAEALGGRIVVVVDGAAAAAARYLAKEQTSVQLHYRGVVLLGPLVR